MKKLKKVLGLMMCGVLAIGCVTGCGGKKSDEDILMAAVTDINSAKSYDMEATMSGKMIMSLQGESQEMDMTAVVTGTSFTDPYKAKSSTTTTVMGTTTKVESYMQKDGDDYVVYAGDGTTWTKTKVADPQNALQAAGIESNQLGSDISKYKKKDDRTEGDKTYLVYDYTISGDEMKEMAESITSSMGGSLFGTDDSDMSEIVNKMIGSVGDITLTILLDREEGTIYRIEYPMADMINSMMDVMMSYFADNANGGGEGDEMGLAEALSQMKIEVPEMNMVMTYKNINSAADFEIPAEALDAEEVTSDAA